MKRLVILTMIALGCALSGSARAADDWQAWMVPASLNSGSTKTIKLAGDQVQMLSMLFNASDAVKARGPNQTVTLTFDLPPGVQMLESDGVFTIQNQQTQAVGSRTQVSFNVQVANSNLVGPKSEWQSQQFFVDMPASVTAGQSYIKMTLTDGANTQTWNWNLQLSTLQPAAQVPQRAKIGLWDYNYRTAQGSAAAEGIASFFADAGIGYIESGGNATLRSALQAQGIVTGGNTHHDYFFTAAAPNQDAAGNVANGGYPSPQDLLELPGSPAPGVSKMIEFAQQGDGVATFDYEPGGWAGFGPKAVAKFKADYGVSDADFQTFRNYVAANGTDTFKTSDPLVSSIWSQWTAFSTDQSAQYMKLLYENFKAQYPEGKMVVTTGRSVGANSAGTLAMGNDNSAMAQYTDVIMPQFYFGYGGTAVKYTAEMTERWKASIEAQGAQTSLQPLLLVRYSGATVFNDTNRLRQQIIATMAHGAEGAVLYYPGMMDAPYWQAVARTNEDLAKYENFYLDGTRVEDVYKVKNMPQGTDTITIYPGYTETVTNPLWDFTAHQWDNRILLTMLNLRDSGNLTFTVETGGLEILQQQGVLSLGNGRWIVGAGQVGFVTLGYVPEPSVAISLLALGGLVLMRRESRAQ